MTPLEQHRFIEKVLWGLKIPEVALTLVFVPGFILFVFGVIPGTYPLYAFVMRLLLFILRILIVMQKRKLEKEFNIARITYVPTIIKKGTKKVEFVTRYK